CVNEFDALGMEININKSGCMRVGDRHDAEVLAIKIYGNSLTWKNEIKYLGIFVTKSNRFQFNFQNTRQKFYRALNGIFGKVGLNTSPVVLCSLVDSFCVLIFMYSAEAMLWNNKMLTRLENAFSHAYMKIFKTFAKKITK